MTKTILLISIKKVFQDQIKKGQKTWEYRKVVPSRKPDEILFYCTDEKSFSLLATHIEMIAESPIKISNECIDSKLSTPSLLRYFGQRQRVVAFKINDFSLLNACTKELIDQSLSINFQGPQGHKFLTSNDSLYKFIEQRAIK